jgi:hypothetical protein
MIVVNKKIDLLIIKIILIIIINNELWLYLY